MNGTSSRHEIDGSMMGAQVEDPSSLWSASPELIPESPSLPANNGAVHQMLVDGVEIEYQRSERFVPIHGVEDTLGRPSGSTAQCAANSRGRPERLWSWAKLTTSEGRVTGHPPALAKA
jgi:hypothetical protein